jgi:hypothetical protein
MGERVGREVEAPTSLMRVEGVSYSCDWFDGHCALPLDYTEMYGRWMRNALSGFYTAVVGKLAALGRSISLVGLEVMLKLSLELVGNCSRANHFGPDFDVRSLWYPSNRNHQ